MVPSSQQPSQAVPTPVIPASCLEQVSTQGPLLQYSQFMLSVHRGHYSCTYGLCGQKYYCSSKYMKQEVYIYIYSRKSIEHQKHNATIFFFNVTQYGSMVMYYLCYESMVNLIKVRMIQSVSALISNDIKFHRHGLFVQILPEIWCKNKKNLFIISCLFDIQKVSPIKLQDVVYIMGVVCSSNLHIL